MVNIISKAEEDWLTCILIIPTQILREYHRAVRRRSQEEQLHRYHVIENTFDIKQLLLKRCSVVKYNIKIVYLDNRWLKCKVSFRIFVNN